jgi:hypothetical protein
MKCLFTPHKFSLASLKFLPHVMYTIPFQTNHHAIVDTKEGICDDPPAFKSTFDQKNYPSKASIESRGSSERASLACKGLWTIPIRGNDIAPKNPVLLNRCQVKVWIDTEKRSSDLPQFITFNFGNIDDLSVFLDVDDDDMDTTNDSFCGPFQEEPYNFCFNEWRYDVDNDCDWGEGCHEKDEIFLPGDDMMVSFDQSEDFSIAYSLSSL